MRPSKVSESTIKRLSIYLRELKNLSKSHVRFISSQDLSSRLGLSDAQIRKDLSYFGAFGKIGVGYYVEGLKSAIESILGVNSKTWKVAIVGAGKLGSALASYSGFSNRGFEIQACFDNDKNKIGQYLSRVRIEDSSRIKNVIRKRDIKIGIIAVPYDQAQKVADELVKGGVKSILNFAPAKIKTDKIVHVKDVDLSMELEGLSFYLSRE